MMANFQLKQASLVASFLLAAFALTADGQGRFSSIAEGFTGVGEAGTIEIGHRAFTAPQLEELIASGLRVQTIDVMPSLLQLRVGQTASLRTLVVVARGRNGQRLDRVPFSVGLEDINPPVLRLDRLWINGHEITAITPGRSTLRIQAAVPDEDGRSATVTMEILVTE